MPRRRARLAIALALAVTVSGCRGVGVGAAESINWASATFSPNPVATGPFHAGAALGFVLALPLCLISWPLAALCYPGEDGDEFYLSASLAPSILTGSLLGTLLGAPFAPFGLPWVPDDPTPYPTPPAADPEDAGAAASPAPDAAEDSPR